MTAQAWIFLGMWLLSLLHVVVLDTALDAARQRRRTPPLTSHDPCEGDCDSTVCQCPDALCAGHVDLACNHGSILCDECRPHCLDCMLDARHDAGIDG